MLFTKFKRRLNSVILRLTRASEDFQDFSSQIGIDGRK